MSQRLRFERVLLVISMFTWLMSCCAIARAETPLPRGYVAEAPLPEGFPPPSETGKVVEKEYPLVRTYSATGRGAFMKCFGYLAIRKHEMTAPVVMEYQFPPPGERVEQQDDDLPVRVERMHFLLEKVSQDEPKQMGLVKVADMPKMRVLSIAHQGRLSAEIIQGAEEKLAAELKARPEIVSAGTTRILGYNGPSTPKEKLFWEIQLPVKEGKE